MEGARLSVHLDRSMSGRESRLGRPTDADTEHGPSQGAVRLAGHF